MMMRRRGGEKGEGSMMMRDGGKVLRGMEGGRGDTHTRRANARLPFTLLTEFDVDDEVAALVGRVAGALHKTRQLGEV